MTASEPNLDATETKGKHTGDRWFVGGVRQKLAGQQALGIFWYDEANKRDVNIASVWYDPRNGDGTLDAGLIAAAPELLAALKAVANLKGWDEDRPISATGIQVMNAIAKSEGRS